MDRRPIVAVLAVHGISDPPAGASARAIADLLVRPGSGGFTEIGLRLPVRRMSPPLRPPPHS